MNKSVIFFDKIYKTLIKAVVLLVIALPCVLILACCASNKVSTVAPLEKPPKAKVFRFVDAAGGKHKMILNEDAAKNDYINKAFRLDKKTLKMEYTGDERYTARLGCDISRHDGIVNWQKMKEWGLEFVILRIAYRGYQTGALKKDEHFEENYNGAKAAGFDVGVYVFSQAITKEEAEEEADFAIEILAGRPLELPFVFDPENVLNDDARTDDITGEVFTMTSEVFCNKVAEAGYIPMIYANMLWEAEKLDMAQLGEKYQFWYADYEARPQSPYQYTFLQYTAFGVVPGATKQKTDLDIQIIPVQQ